MRGWIKTLITWRVPEVGSGSTLRNCTTNSSKDISLMRNGSQLGGFPKFKIVSFASRDFSVISNRHYNDVTNFPLFIKKIIIFQLVILILVSYISHIYTNDHLLHLKTLSRVSHKEWWQMKLINLTEEYINVIMTHLSLHLLKDCLKLKWK